MTRLQRAQKKKLASTEVKNISERIMHAQQRVCLGIQMMFVLSPRHKRICTVKQF